MFEANIQKHTNTIFVNEITTQSLSVALVRTSHSLPYQKNLDINSFESVRIIWPGQIRRIFQWIRQDFGTGSVCLIQWVGLCAIHHSVNIVTTEDFSCEISHQHKLLSSKYCGQLIHFRNLFCKLFCGIPLNGSQRGSLRVNRDASHCLFQALIMLINGFK